MLDLGESGTGPVPDPYDPLKDVCKNCNRPRSEHRMSRSGAICVSGRRFALDRAALQQAFQEAFPHKRSD